ncbi:MAG: NAD-dependent epimerase/dehydratase family protein [Chitinophagaceae bacterium]|nr:NAD-dependent epimerase/dehydratase family protein [Chitinophagaceae bacterium]
MVLITGATGLLGSHLLKKLVNDGQTVKALYRSEIPQIEGSDKAIWVQGDILDTVSLEEAMAGVEYVYHCAAMVSFNPRKKAQMHKVNVEGTANVVNACLDAGVKRLLHVSSIAAMGRIREDSPINEDMVWSEETSNSEYGKTKYLAELETWRGIGEGLDVVIVNPVIILGAGNWEKGSSEIFKSAYEEFPWYTEGVSGFVDVEDVVRAMVMLMHAVKITGERFIISADNYPFRSMFTWIARNFNKRPPHRKVTPLIAGLVWRWEAIKSFFTGKDPMLTRETARTAAAKVQIDNRKIQRFFPNFKYSSMDDSLERICEELKKMHNL